jgi:hypothetical protein
MWLSTTFFNVDFFVFFDFDAHLFQLSSHCLLFLKTQHHYPEFGPKLSEIQKKKPRKKVY